MAVVWTILLIVIIAYSIVGWTLFFLQPRFLYAPIREITYTPADINLAYEKLALKTEDGLKIAAWYIPAENAKYTVLFCHGNAGNMTHRLDSINIFNEMGLNCLLFDYRGYGDSQGKPTEAGTYMDAAAAWKWLTEKKQIPSNRIIIFGRSLGGSIAAHLAARVNPRALVLESTFTSYEQIGKKFYPYMPVHLFAKFHYNTLEYVKNVRCPILFIHSRNDEIVPFEFSLRLYAAAAEPKRFLEITGSHNDGFLFSGAVYTDGWKDWLHAISEHHAEHAGRQRIS
ncbi:MAG: alpha/beta hydrolase [Phycisphaerae bacterium]|nr:alpha/beta hydrolase [Phycisphaerae bacterium]